ncbi:PAS domain S-box protein [Methanospirillum lacunae]|nr:PAS domain S-box protein [Methanospirillum lacunae]
MNCEPAEDQDLHILIIENAQILYPLILKAFESWEKKSHFTCIHSLEQVYQVIHEDPPDIIYIEEKFLNSESSFFGENAELYKIPIIFLLQNNISDLPDLLSQHQFIEYIPITERILNALPEICDRILKEWKAVSARQSVEKELSKFYQICNNNEFQALPSKLDDQGNTIDYLQLIKLFWEKSNDGLIICEIIYNSSKFPIDFKIIESNPAFEEKFSQVTDNIHGKKLTELNSQFLNDLTDRLLHVILTGDISNDKLFLNVNYLKYNIKIFDINETIIGIQFFKIQNTQSDKVDQNSEKRTSFFNDIAIEDFWDWQITEDLIDISPKWYAAFGYNYNEVGNNLQSWKSLVHQEDIQSLEKKMHNIIHREDTVLEHEFRIKTKTGEWKWILIKGMVVSGFGNECLNKISGLIVDISAWKNLETQFAQEHQELIETYNQCSLSEEHLKRKVSDLYVSEQMLKINEEKLLLAQKIGKIGCWEYSFQTEIVWASAETLKIFGYPPIAGDVSLEKIKKCIPDYDDFIQLLSKQIIEVDEFNQVLMIHPVDGSPQKFIHLVAIIQRDEFGKNQKITGVIQDITKIKANEEKLKETNNFLENLINLANVPIIVWDSAFRITRCNHSFEKLTGLSSQDALGKSLKIIFPPSLVDRSMRLIKSTLEGVRWETVELQIQHTDGTIKTVVWNSSTLFSDDGNVPIATIAQGQDVTAKNKYENERNIAIEQVKQNLAQLAILNDGIRNPLTIISLLSSGENENQEKNVILEQVNIINDIVTQLDKRWAESDKILKFLTKHHQISINPVTNNQEIQLKINQSISEKEEPQLLVEESQGLLFSILDCLDDFVYVVDIESYELVFINRRLRNLVGDFPGKKCYQIFQKDNDNPCPYCPNSYLIDEYGPTGVYRWESTKPDNKRVYSCRDWAFRWFDGRFVKIEIASDITEQRQTETGIRNEEEKFRTIAEHIKTGFFIFQNDSFVFVNDALTEIIGYSHNEIYNKKMIEFLDPIDYEWIKEISRQRKEGKQVPDKYIIHVKTKDGSNKTLELFISQIFFQESPALLGTINDITEKEHIERELWDSEDRFWTLLQNIPEYIILHKKGKILFANNSALYALGYTSEEMVGSNLLEYLTPESKKNVIKIISGSGNKTIPPVTFITKEGIEKITIIHKFFIQYENSIISLDILKDITEQKRIEETLRKKIENEVAIISIIPDLIYTIDWKGVILENKTKGLSLFSSNPELDQGKSLHELLPCHLANQIIQIINIAISTNLKQHFEFFLDDEKQRHWYEIYVIYCSPNEVTALFRNISGIKSQGTMIKELNMRFNLLISLLNQDIDSLIATINFLEKKSLESSNLEMIHENIQLAHNEGNQIEKIINFFVQYNNHNSHLCQWQNITSLINSITLIFKSSDIEIINQIEDNIEIYADLMLRQVFFILIKNSIDHGGDVQKIKLFSESMNNSLIIIYEDDGRGICNNDKTHIFDRNFKGKIGSSLFLVREILSMTDILIRETGKEGDGVKFEIVLPSGSFRRTFIE